MGVACIVLKIRVKRISLNTPILGIWARLQRPLGVKLFNSLRFCGLQDAIIIMEQTLVSYCPVVKSLVDSVYINSSKSWVKTDSRREMSKGEFS